MSSFRPRRGWPILPSLAGYDPAWLKTDVAAGLAIAAVGIPSAIAYPAIAGLPPETGLYASIFPLIAYALFGPSRQLVVGPDAATMTVLAAVLAGSGAGGDRVSTAAALALAVGGLCLGARALRLGVLAGFLSRPILTGFFAGISLSILVGQIGRFTGMKIAAEGLLAPILELARRAGEIHAPSLLLGLAMLALLLVSARWKALPLPGPVVVVALSALLSWLLDFRGHGIAVVGALPGGLPGLALAWPALPFDRLVLGAAAVFLVSFGAGIVTARSFGARGGYPVDANRELTGFGAANLAAGLFGAFPVTASDSRTAVNASVGGRTQVAGLVAAGVVLAMLVWLNDALALLPIPALGAILAAAAISLIDVAALRAIWRISPIEFVFALIALAGPIGLGVLNGVVIAIGATLAYVLVKNMYPRDAMLGLVPGRDGFYKLHRRMDARAVPGLAICLIEGSILFFNADHVQRRLRAVAAGLPADARWLVLDATAVVQVDSTAAGMLDEMRVELDAQGLRLGLAELNSEVRDLLARAGLLDAIGAEMIFEDLEDVLRAFHAQPKEETP